VETPGGSRIVVRRDGLALWNHHVGESWSAGGFATFQAEIASQAARFDTLCASPNGPFLGFFLEAPGHLDAAALEAATARVHAALRARVRGARACLFVLQLLHTSEDEALRHFLPDCAILRVALPRPDYVWHLPAEFDTPAGTAFETRIANALLDCLVAWHQGDLSP
jgi:hypothetical protein